MGFFDKAKHFMGGHGTKVEITRLERQEPNAVQFPLTDSVFKGNFTITADKESVVLRTFYELCAEKKHADGRIETVLIDRDEHNEKTDIIGLDLKWPFTMQAGETKELSFGIWNVDIPGTLKKLGYADPAQGLKAPELQIYVRVVADVKGSPFDPEAKVKINVVA